MICHATLVAHRHKCGKGVHTDCCHGSSNVGSWAMELKERVQLVMRIRGINAEAWADATNGAVSRSYIDALRRGARGERLSQQKAAALSDAARISWRWLLSEEGPMTLDDSSTRHDSSLVLDEQVYSSLQEMIDLMGARGDQEIFKALKRQRFADGDRGADYWEKEYKRLKERKARLLSLEHDAELANARPVHSDAIEAALDHVPSVRRRAPGEPPPRYEEDDEDEEPAKKVTKKGAKR